MPRTVAALYDSREDAELVRASLVTSLKATSPRIIGKDTAGAIGGLNFDRKDADAYREVVNEGAYLLVAQVSDGANAEQIIELLTRPGKGDPSAIAGQSGAYAENGGVEISSAADQAKSARPGASAPERPEHVESTERTSTAVSSQEDSQERPLITQTAGTIKAAPAISEEARIPVVEEELRIGKREVSRGGARVQSFTRDMPAQEQVTLQEEVVEVDSRSSKRCLSDDEIEAAGLFKEREFEIVEMREEPVVTKVAVVREEIVVRKTTKGRTETIRDTVRHTEVEVENLSASDHRLSEQSSRAAGGRSDPIEETALSSEAPRRSSKGKERAG